MRKQQAGVSELNEEMCSYFYRFFHLNLIDFDAKQLVFKIVVEIETVSVLHIFPSRILVKDTCFPTGQGLQGTAELSLLCAGSERMIVTITLSQAPATVVHLYYICQKTNKKNPKTCHLCQWLCESPLRRIPLPR